MGAPGPEPRSGPVAWISRGALAQNARDAAGRGIRSFAPSVLQADAWGHGEALVRDVLAGAGLAPAEPNPDDRALGGATLFGLPGGADGARPALRLTGTVLSVKALRRGEGVSYGYAFRAESDTRVALVTGGYAQGIVRALGNAARVLVGEGRHPIVGRVAMDVCVVDVGDAAVGRGDAVVFLGDAAHGEPGLEEWMRATNLTAAELVTAVGLRALREVVA